MTKDDLLAQAVKLRTEGDAEKAREILVPLAADHPGDAVIAYQTAWTHDVLGLEDEAVAYYETALALPELSDADRQGAYTGLGSTFRALGRYPESVAILSRASEEYPENGALRTFLAMALYNSGRYHDAVGSLLRLLAETSTDEAVQRYRRAIEHYSHDLDAIG